MEIWKTIDIWRVVKIQFLVNFIRHLGYFENPPYRKDSLSLMWALCRHECVRCLANVVSSRSTQQCFWNNSPLYIEIFSREGKLKCMATHSSFLEAKRSLILDDEGMILAHGNCRMTNLNVSLLASYCQRKKVHYLMLNLWSPRLMSQTMYHSSFQQCLSNNGTWSQRNLLQNLQCLLCGFGALYLVVCSTSDVWFVHVCLSQVHFMHPNWMAS